MKIIDVQNKLGGIQTDVLAVPPLIFDELFKELRMAERTVETLKFTEKQCLFRTLGSSCTGVESRYAPAEATGVIAKVAFEFPIRLLQTEAPYGLSFGMHSKPEKEVLS